MNKEEFLKIQTCVLKVNIHCDGCKHKVKKILQKIEGVYTVKIDSEQGKVTVSGNVDSATLVKKLTKNGKHAEIWGAQKNSNNNNNQNQLINNQFKNLQLDNGKGGNNNKGQQPQKGGGGGGGNINNTPKGGGGNGNANNNQPKGGQNNTQFPQMKGFQDLKMGQFMKDMKMPVAVSNNNKDQNVKSVKFKMPEEDDDLSDSEFDSEFDDDDDEFDDDDMEDDLDVGPPLNKMKSEMVSKGHGGGLPPNMMMHNVLNMKGGNAGGANGKKGGGSVIPVQANQGKKGGGGGAIPVQANHGKKGGNVVSNNGGGNQNHAAAGKGGKGGGGGQNKNGGGGGGMASMMNGGGGIGQMGSRPMGYQQMGQMNNLAAVQGLPAMGGGGDVAAGNPYYQQQMAAAMMMNQQRANGNERFQPMMYARPPPAVNYMPPYQGYSYPPPGERLDQYTMFSDENTSSCAVM